MLLVLVVMVVEGKRSNCDGGLLSCCVMGLAVWGSVRRRPSRPISRRSSYSRALSAVVHAPQHSRVLLPVSLVTLVSAAITKPPQSGGAPLGILFVDYVPPKMVDCTVDCTVDDQDDQDDQVARFYIIIARQHDAWMTRRKRQLQSVRGICRLGSAFVRPTF